MYNIRIIFVLLISFFLNNSRSLANQDTIIRNVKLSKEAIETVKYNPQKDIYVGVSPSKAKIVIIEYGAFSCPHCSSFYSHVIPYIEQRYINKGDSISIIHRPFAADAPCLMAMMALECVNNKRQMIGVLYKNQKDWVFQSNYMERLQEMFAMGGLDKKHFTSCIADTKKRFDLLQERIDVIEKVGLTRTPTVIINNEIIGDISMKAIDKKIAKELNQ